MAKFSFNKVLIGRGRVGLLERWVMKGGKIMYRLYEGGKQVGRNVTCGADPTDEAQAIRRLGKKWAKAEIRFIVMLDTMDVLWGYQERIDEAVRRGR